MNKRSIFSIFYLFSFSFSQVWIDATPEILLYDIDFSDQKNNFRIMRPFIHDNGDNFKLGIQYENYINNNAPNQENMGNKYFGKGLGSFFSYKIALNRKYFFITAEPYILNVDKGIVDEPSYPNYYTDQNQVIRPSERPGHFKWLNDRQLKADKSGIREFQLYFKYKGILTGIANVNRWWGPGIHTSLSMSNNSSGFPHYFFGLNDIDLYKNKLKFNMNYMVGEVGVYQRPFFFTGVSGMLTHYSKENNITLGFTRTYVSGGINLPGDRQWSIKDAAALPAESILLSSKKNLWYTQGKGTDRWDQALTFIAHGNFKPSNLQIFFEIGFNDHVHNLYELRAHWDVSAAYLYGVRKKGLFGSKNIVFGVEYLDLIQRTFSDHRGTTGSWFDEEIYNSNSYKGRRWSAHSGADSDDFYLFLGYQGENLTILPAFNYERHGVVYHFPPEVKIELRLSIIYKYNDWIFDLYYENEYFENIGFVNSNDNVWLDKPLIGSIRRTNTLIFKIQKNLFFKI